VSREGKNLLISAAATCHSETAASGYARVSTVGQTLAALNPQACDMGFVAFLAQDGMVPALKSNQPTVSLLVS
jgi:hypothetical protein